MPAPRSSRSSAYIRHLCALGLPDAQVMPQLVEALRELVGADKGMFYWADASYEIAQLYAENDEVYRTLPAYTALRASGHIRTLMGDFSDWMRGSARFTNSAHIDRAFLASAFYGEVVQPCHCRHLIVAVVRDTRRGWGAFFLTRERNRPAFTDAEQHLLESFNQHALHALQPPSRAVSGYADSEDEAVLLLDPQAHILHRSPAAERLLRLAQDRTVGDASTARFAIPLQALLRRLRDCLSGTPSRAARVETENRWGRFLWRAYPMSAVEGAAQDAPLVLHMQLQRASPLALARGAYVLGLSVQQQVVGTRWAEGQSQRAIAQALGVKESTVIDHLRRIYDRLDVRDSAALAEALSVAGRHNMVRERSGRQLAA